MVCFSVTCAVPRFQLPVYEPGVFWATWLGVLIIEVLAPDSPGDALASLISTHSYRTIKVTLSTRDAIKTSFCDSQHLGYRMQPRGK